eukprot:8341291-Alexandrium_andersonii.AAC.1
MSASLVGSEMCIRDRPRSWLGRAGGRGARPATESPMDGPVIAEELARGGSPAGPGSTCCTAVWLRAR